MNVLICVGSSCHLKGSHELVELFQNAIDENHLEGIVSLSGSFCTGKCNRVGVTVTVDDEIYPGITKENFKEFFNEKIRKKARGGAGYCRTDLPGRNETAKTATSASGIAP